MTDGALWLEETVGVMPIGGVRVLEIGGDDARSWLNGQITNDIRDSKEGDAVYALAITVKGRILSDVWALCVGPDAFWLEVQEAAVPSLLESFETQIIMEDVEPAVTDQAVVTVQGPKGELIRSKAESLGTVFDCRRLRGTGFDVIVPNGSEAEVTRALGEAAHTHGGGAVQEDEWNLARLRQRMPRYGYDFGTGHYPQEAGLKERAISFNKGCYLGQEVVCMLENRGQLSRSLVALTLPLGAEFPTEALLMDGDKNVGALTSWTRDPEHHAMLALGYVKRASAKAGHELKVAGHNARIEAIVSAPPVTRA